MCFRGGMTIWWWTWETPGWTPGPSCPPSGPPSPSAPSMSMLWRWLAPGKYTLYPKRLGNRGIVLLYSCKFNDQINHLLRQEPKNLKTSLLLGQHINCVISYFYSATSSFCILHPRSETHLKFSKHFLSCTDHVYWPHPPHAPHS